MMDYEPMKRGGKVRAKGKKKAIKKEKIGGVSQRVKQVQTVKVNIDTGKRTRRKVGKKAKTQATTQGSEMFGFRLGSSMPRVAVGPIPQPEQETSKLDLVLSKIAEQQKETEKQQKMIENIRDTRQPTGQAGVSMMIPEDVECGGFIPCPPSPISRKRVEGQSASRPLIEEIESRPINPLIMPPKEISSSVKNKLESAFVGWPPGEQIPPIPIASPIQPQTPRLKIPRKSKSSKSK